MARAREPIARAGDPMARASGQGLQYLRSTDIRAMSVPALWFGLRNMQIVPKSRAKTRPH